MLEGTCKSCGVTGPMRYRDVCSTRCREYLRRHPGHRYQSRHCSFCDTPLPAGSHQAQRYCDSRCSSRAQKRRDGRTDKPYTSYERCGYCAKPLAGGPRARRYCDAWCGQRARNGATAIQEIAARRCRHCGGALPERARLNQYYCASTCTVVANQSIRRARRLGLPAERVDRIAVFERDDWRCHICGKLTDPAAPSRAPEAPSIDHLIPMADAESPGHVWTNVACAHLRCNMAKNHRATSTDRELHRKLAAKIGVTAWRESLRTVVPR